MVSEISQSDMVETVDDPGPVLDAPDPGKPLVENICCLDLVFHDGIVAHRRHNVKDRAGILFGKVRGMLVRFIVERLSTCIRMKVLLIL